MLSDLFIGNSKSVDCCFVKGRAHPKTQESQRRMIRPQKQTDICQGTWVLPFTLHTRLISHAIISCAFLSFSTYLPILLSSCIIQIIQINDSYTRCKLSTVFKIENCLALFFASDETSLIEPVCIICITSSTLLINASLVVSSHKNPETPF